MTCEVRWTQWDRVNCGNSPKLKLVHLSIPTMNEEVGVQFPYQLLFFNVPAHVPEHRNPPKCRHKLNASGNMAPAVQNVRFKQDIIVFEFVYLSSTSCKLSCCNAS